MGTYIDENEININPEADVKKLQALVKRLEQQNQVLRSKQNESEPEKSSETVLKANVRADENSSSYSSTRSKDVKQLLMTKSDAETIEVLDLNEPHTDDEDSWLYSSPKKTSPTDSKSKPHDWMRQDLEDPSPEVALTRRSLVFKLNDAARMVRSPSSGGLSSSMLTPSPASSPMSQTYRPPQVSSTASSPLSQIHKSFGADSPNSSSHISPQTRSYIQSRQERLQQQDTAEPPELEEARPAIKKPLRGLEDVLDNSSTRVNTNTFRKKKNPFLSNTVVIGSEEAEDEGLSAKPVKASNRDTVDTGKSTPEHELRVSGGSSGGGRTLSRNSSSENPTSESPRGADYKLTDVVDVQVLARMQEESLRQSMNSPKLAKKTLVRPKPANDSSNGYGSTRSSPGRFLDNEGYSGSMHRSNQSLGSLSSNSDSPANSPYSSQYLDSTHQATDGHRRSLPNLAKSMPLTLPSHPSDPELSAQESSKSTAQSRSVQQRRGSPSMLASSGVSRYQGNPANQRRGVSPQMGNRTMDYSKSSLPGANRSSPLQQQQQKSQMARTISPKRVASSGGGSNSLQSPQRTFSPQRTLSPQRVGHSAVDRTVSPQRSSLPTPRSSGIPRPGSASKLPAPKKSAIPASRRAALFNKNTTGDESWKDGCY